mmetsp:Transcript_15046/g.30335  ORF Transcript_15046/g.30335 Transcript_15046/m.30335 type:complete len:83 (+) Transcript_15046:397-645(+)
MCSGYFFLHGVVLPVLPKQEFLATPSAGETVLTLLGVDNAEEWNPHTGTTFADRRMVSATNDLFCVMVELLKLLPSGHQTKA